MYIFCICPIHFVKYGHCHPRSLKTGRRSVVAWRQQFTFEWVEWHRVGTVTARGAPGRVVHYDSILPDCYAEMFVCWWPQDWRGTMTRDTWHVTGGCWAAPRTCSTEYISWPEYAVSWWSKVWRGSGHWLDIPSRVRDRRGWKSVRRRQRCDKTRPLHLPVSRVTCHNTLLPGTLTTNTLYTDTEGEWVLHAGSGHYGPQYPHDGG